MVDWNHYKARRIMEEELNRKLSMYEIVHHIDRNPRNNNISNLKLMSVEEHGSIHGGCKKQKHLKSPWNKLSKETIEIILEFHKNGFNYSQISKETGISDNAIRDHILRHTPLKRSGTQNGKKR